MNSHLLFAPRRARDTDFFCSSSVAPNYGSFPPRKNRLRGEQTYRLVILCVCAAVLHWGDSFVLPMDALRAARCAFVREPFQSIFRELTLVLLLFPHSTLLRTTCQLPLRRPHCPTRDSLASGIQSLEGLSLSLLVPHNIRQHSALLLQRCQCLQQALSLVSVLPMDTRQLPTAMGPTNSSSSGMVTTSAKEASVLAHRNTIRVPSLQHASRPPPQCRK